MRREYIPTGLTLFRALSPFYLPPLFLGGYYRGGVILAIAAAISDLEGSLARLWKCESDLGAMLDIGADKAFAWTVAGIAWWVCDYNIAYLIAFAVIFAYDLYGGYLRYYGMIRLPSRAGKIKTALLFPGLIVMIWPTTGWLDSLPIQMISFVIIWGAAIFATWSALALYFRLVPDVPNLRELFSIRGA